MKTIRSGILPIACALGFTALVPMSASAGDRYVLPKGFVFSSMTTPAAAATVPAVGVEEKAGAVSASAGTASTSTPIPFTMPGDRALLRDRQENIIEEQRGRLSQLRQLSGKVVPANFVEEGQGDIVAPYEGKLLDTDKYQ
jgi:hypothetical protein